MKTLETLEQDAKQARDDMREVMLDEFGIGATLSDRILSQIIRAVQSNIAHNDAKREISGDGSGESLPEVSKEDRDSDGWIEWKGGDCPVKSSETVEVKFRLQTIKNDIDLAGVYRWHHADKSGLIDGDPQCDIIAYRIVKQYTKALSPSTVKWIYPKSVMCADLGVFQNCSSKWHGMAAKQSAHSCLSKSSRNFGNLIRRNWELWQIGKTVIDYQDA